MEQGYLIGLVMALAGLAMFVLGFFAGQKSVRVVGTRTERLQVSERLEIERTIPDTPKGPTMNDYEGAAEQTVTLPPQWRHLVNSSKEGAK